MRALRLITLKPKPAGMYPHLLLYMAFLQLLTLGQCHVEHKHAV